MNLYLIQIRASNDPKLIFFYKIKNKNEEIVREILI